MGREPLVFLSHSGADTEAARKLKGLLLASPDAREAGLKVWFDKDDLRPGQWQPQLEQAIQEASAFVVFVGSRGIVNWVDIEVRTALSRAATDKDFLFIPVFAPEIGANVLPPFARLYQGVADPLGQGDERAKLLKAVLKADWDKAARLIEEPFVGLRAMREEEADRFFGRDKEIEELADKLRKHRIVAVVADSGTGKSSLARAGFAPVFRGGALIDPMREEARDKIWQVVTMRPLSNPEEGLKTGVSEAAEKLGRSGGERADLRKRIALGDPSETAYALQCDLPTKTTATLLIVDQFEELFTTTPSALQAPFVKLLLDLAEGDKDVRIILTVRSDYFNLASGVKDAAGRPALFDRLTAGNNDAILRLKAMSPAGLSEAVLEPLRLAGETNAAALADAVQTDISHQASDLPLLQVALRAAWQEHQAAGKTMLECYQSVGRVSGALAREAGKAREKLSPEDQGRLESIFVRLVRLGDTGGATRRDASLDDFDPKRRALLQKLGQDEYGRLVSVGETHAELAHEALITQWPWLHETLTGNAADVRRLARLMERAKDWSAAPDEKKDDYLANGAERELLSDLARRRADWVSKAERDFVAASDKAFQDDVASEQRKNRLIRVAALVAAIFAILAAGFGLYSQVQRWRADTQTLLADEAVKNADQKAEEALRNQSVALTALADIEATAHPVNAAKLALAAWPRGDEARIAPPKLHETLDALSKIVPTLNERRLLKGHGGPVRSAAFSPDGKRVVTASEDGAARLWDAETGREIAALKGHDNVVISAAFSPDGKRIVTASWDKTARVWDAETGREIATLKGHSYFVNSAAFSPDGRRVVTAASDETARVWDAETGQEIATLKGHDSVVNYAAFSPDGKRVVTGSEDNTARIWDAGTGREVAALKGHNSDVTSAAFSPDGQRVVTASWDKTARIWDAATGQEIRALKGHDGVVNSAAFSPDGRRVVTASNDKTARVWDADTGQEIAPLKGHNDGVTSAAFSPDSQRVVTASFDQTARVWDAVIGQEIAALKGHDDRVWSAAFSPDGRRVVTASDDKTARIWDVGGAIPTGNILQVACALLKMHEDPVSLDGVTQYPLTFDRPFICVTDPPPPDLAAEAK